MLRMVADNVALVRGARRGAGGRRRPRLGRADRLELGAAAARRLPGRRRAVGAVRAGRRHPPDRRLPGDGAATRSSTSSTSSSPGRAEAELDERRPPVAARLLLHGVRRRARRRPAAARSPRSRTARGCATASPTPTPMPAWLTDDDLDVYAGEFERTGFTGGLNRYRNVDRDWEDLVGVPRPADRGAGAVRRRRPGRPDDLGDAARSSASARRCRGCTARSSCPAAGTGPSRSARPRSTRRCSSSSASLLTLLADDGRPAGPRRDRRRRLRRPPRRRTPGTCSAGCSSARRCGPPSSPSPTTGRRTRCTCRSPSPAPAAKPIRYEVERTRDGSSFATRRVVARQERGIVARAHRRLPPRRARRRVRDAGDAGHPRSGRPAASGATTTRSSSRATSRCATGDRLPHARRAWFRPTAPVPDDPLLHLQALAYLSDHGPTRAAREPHADLADDARRMSVSLDHSVWFHRPVDVNQWLLSRARPGGHRPWPRPVARHDPHRRRHAPGHRRPGGPAAQPLTLLLSFEIGPNGPISKDRSRSRPPS